MRLNAWRKHCLTRKKTFVIDLPQELSFTVCTVEVVLETRGKYQVSAGTFWNPIERSQDTLSSGPNLTRCLGSLHIKDWPCPWWHPCGAYHGG